MVAKLTCFFLGHRWKNFGCNRTRAAALGHLCTKAGDLSLCTRCGYVWDDLGWDSDNPEAFKRYHDVRFGELLSFAKERWPEYEVHKVQRRP